MSKVSIDKKVLKQLTETLQSIREYIEAEDEDIITLCKDAYKGLCKALRFFYTRNPELNCDPADITTNISPDKIKDFNDIRNLIGVNIWVENGEGKNIFETSPITSIEHLRQVLNLLADPDNYSYMTLNPKYFEDYNFADIYADWKENYLIPSEFEDMIDLIIDEEKMVLGENPATESIQVIVYG